MLLFATSIPNSYQTNCTKYGMGTADFARFVTLCVLVGLVAFGLAAVAAPPDPVIQLLYFAVLIPVVIVVSYIFS